MHEQGLTERGAWRRRIVRARNARSLIRWAGRAAAAKRPRLKRKALMSSKKPPILRCLSQPKFALFEGGMFPHYTTGWMMRVGAGWLAWELTESPAWLGIIAAADLMPIALLAPIAGAWTDRVNPLRLIRFAESMLFLHAALLAATTALGLINIHILFALTVFAGLVYPFHSTARAVDHPAHVPREDSPRRRRARFRFVPFEQVSALHLRPSSFPCSA